MIAAAMSLVAFGLLAVGVANPAGRLRPCGHPETFSSRVQHLTGLRFGATHCCIVLSMYSEIRAIDAAQDDYRKVHGSYTTSVNDVTNYIGNYPPFSFDLKTNDQHWYAIVLAQNRFPGNYLFEGNSSNLRTYFNPSRPATTNDMVLYRF